MAAPRHRSIASVLLGALLIGMLIASGGCSKPPGEFYVDTSIKELIGQDPGLYELYAPLDVPARRPNVVFLRQGKDIIVAAGDSLELKIGKYLTQGTFSLIGRRMGQPKVWFAVDGVILHNRLAERISHRLEWAFPAYEAFSPATVHDYTTVDLGRLDYDQDAFLRHVLDGKMARITGMLRIDDTEPGVRRYLVESRNLKVEITQVGQNLGCFLDLVHAIDIPLVAYGRLLSLNPLDDGTDSDRGSTRIIGDFIVDYLQYSQDILVRNTAGATQS